MSISAVYDVASVWACDGQTASASRAETPRGSASSSRLPQPSFHERGRALQTLHERDRSHSPNIPSPNRFPARERDPWLPWADSRREEKMVDLPTESGIRDGRQCVVTKRGQPLIESARILPKKLNGTQHEYLMRSNCWPWLKAFWGEEKVNMLQSLLLSEESTMDMERLYNRITLEIHVHRYWDRAMCALRPIWVNEDRTEMQIAFHWLPLKENIPGAAKHVRSDFVSTTENPYQDPKYRPRETPGGNNLVFHTETGARISSGYVFTVKTDNKRERPLPSMELLVIRWHLSRIACMQGKAEDEDSDYESDGGSVSVRSGSRSPIVDTN
ncbi:hypothetical protein N7501_003146 [Penicillium viridicatum]|nr:hypothetical protein N7501_003146 [Penicillium viridicatum]